MYGQETGKKPPATALPNDDRQVGLDEWDDIVADRFKVPKSLMKAVRSQESGGNVNAVSPTGVKGRYQVTEATAKQYGLDRNDPFQQSVAAAKHLRAMYDATPGDDDDTRWLGSVAKYYGGDNAVQGDQISGSSVDGVSNPARHVESVARKWGELRKAERQQQPQQPVPSTIAVGHSQQYKPLAQRPQPRTPSTATPNVFSRNSAQQQQQATQEAQKALDFRNVNPMAEAQRLTGRVMSNPGAEQRRKIADQYNQKSWLGQRGEDLRQGWESFKTGAADTVLGAADVVGSAAGGDFRPLKEAVRGIGLAASNVPVSKYNPFAQNWSEAERAKVTAENEQAMQQLAQERNTRQANDPLFRRIQRERQEQQLAREAAPSLTSRVTRGIGDAVLNLPAMVGAAELGGIPAVTALTAAQQDFARDPQGAALNTVGAGLPIVAGKAISPLAARAAGRVAPALQRPVQLGIEGAAGGAANVAQYAGTQAALGREIDPQEAVSLGITGTVLSGAMAPKLADVQRQNALRRIEREAQTWQPKEAQPPTTPIPPTTPDAPPTTPIPPAAAGGPKRENFPAGMVGDMLFQAAQLDFQRSGKAGKAGKAEKPQMQASDLRAQVDALKIEAQDAEGAGNPAAAAAKYEAAQSQLGQLRAQAKAAGDTPLYSAISEEMAINKANWQAAGRAARSAKPAPVKQAVPPAEPLPPQEQQQGEKRRAPGMVNPKFAEQSRIIGQQREAMRQQAGSDAPTRDLSAPLPAGEAKTPQPVQEITRTTAEIPRVRRDKIPNDIAPVQGAPISEVKMQNTSELPPFPKLTPPTNRITEGAGNELPRRVSQPLEGQPIEPPTRFTEYEGGEMQRYSKPLEGQPAEVPEKAQSVYSPEEAAVREREALPPVERRRALREAALKGQFGKLSEASRAGATENRSLVGNAQLRRLLGLPEMPAYRLPDAEINPKTGEPYVNPAWNEAAQDTLNALAAVAGKERSSQINFGVGDAGSRGEMGDLFLAVRKLAQHKGEALEPALREAFKETVGRARTAQSGYQEFQVDERTGNIRNSLYELTRRGELTKDEIRAHQAAWREVAAEFGISRNQADELFKGMRAEARTRAERAGARESDGADRSASRGGTGRVVEPVEQRATGTDGGGRAAVREVTPEGYGPAEPTKDSRSPYPSDYPSTMEEQRLESSIREGEMLLRGRMSKEKRAMTERAVANSKAKLAALRGENDQQFGDRTPAPSAMEIDRDIPKTRPRRNDKAYEEPKEEAQPQAPDVARDLAADRAAGSAKAEANAPAEVAPATPTGKTPLATVKNIIRRAREREAAKGDREDVAELRRMKVDNNPFAQGLRAMSDAELAAEITEMGGDPAKLRNNKEMMVRWLTREIGRKTVAGEYGTAPDVSAKKAEFEELQRKPTPEQLKASALDKLKVSEDEAVKLMETLAESEKNAANPYLSAKDRARYNQAWDQVFDAGLTDAEMRRMQGVYQERQKPKFVSEAEARLNEYFSGKRAGSGVEQLVDTTIVAGYKAYKAGVKFADWAKTVIDEVGERARPYLQKVWRDLKADRPAEQTRATLGKQMAREALLRAKAASLTPDEANTLLRQMGAEAPQGTDPARFAVSLASALEKLGTNNVAEARNKVQKFLTPTAFGDAARKFREVAKAGRELRVSGLTADEVWTLRDAVPLDQSRAAALTNRTPEQRSAAGQKAAQTRAANVAARQEQTRSAIAGVKEARAQAEAAGVAPVAAEAAREPEQRRSSSERSPDYVPDAEAATSEWGWLRGRRRAFTEDVKWLREEGREKEAQHLESRFPAKTQIEKDSFQSESTVSSDDFRKLWFHGGSWKGDAPRTGIWFARNREGAGINYDTGQNQNIVASYLTPRKVWDAGDRFYSVSPETASRLRSEGYDAIVGDNLANGPSVYVLNPDIVHLPPQSRAEAPKSEDIAARIARLDPTLTRAEIETYRNQQQKAATARQADKPEMGEDAALARLKRLQAAAQKSRFSFGELPNEPKGPVATMFGGQKILDNLRAGRRKIPAKEIPADFKAVDWITKQAESLARQSLSEADRAKLADPKLSNADRLQLLGKAKITPEQEAGFQQAAKDAFAALQANNYRDLQDAAQRMNAITSAPATNWEKASAIRKAAMLSRPVSHLRNLIGNTAFQNLEEAARLPGSVGDTLLGTLTNRRTLQGTSFEDSARAIYAAATDGVQAAKDAMAGRSNEDIAKALQVREVHFNTPWIDKAVKTVFRSLGAADQIFYTGAYDRAIREAAKLTARNEARQGIINRKDIAAREQSLLAAPTAQMELDAKAAAEVAVFRNDNKLSDTIGKVRQNLGDKANFGLDLVLPFDRTPTNVVLRALEYSPLGLARGGAKAVAGSARARRAERAAKKAGTPSKAEVQAAIDQAFTPTQQRSAAQLLGRGVVGTGLLALGYALAEKGLMTGFYDDEDYKGEAMKRAAGAQPLAIQIGGRWYGLSGISPLGMALGMGATMHNESKKKDGDIYGGAAKAAKEQVMETPLLSSAKDLAKDVERVSKDRANAGKLVGNLASSFVPGILNDVSQSIPGLRDPYEREVKDDPKKVKGLRRALREGAGQVGARIPGVRKLLPVKKDITGKPVESRLLAPIDPFSSRPAVRPLPRARR